jgi:hypothetical protein
MALALVALIAVSGVGAQAKKQITFASRDFVELKTTRYLIY